MLSSAKSHCKEKLGSLVEYTSHDQEEVLLSFLREKYDDDFRFWIGLRDHQHEENFVWETSGQQVNCKLSCSRMFDSHEKLLKK